MATSPSAVPSPSSSNRQIWRFGLMCSAFAVLWAIGSIYGLGVESPFDTFLCNQLATASAWGLRTIGWSASADILRPNMLLLNGQPSVIVGPPCDGLVLYVLLAGFVLAYPGPTRRRLWFIPLGILGLWLLNVIRIVALALNYRYSPETFDFDHHYAFNAVAYAALGGMWLLWTRQNISSTGSVASLPTRHHWLTKRVIVGGSLLVLLIVVSICQKQAVTALSIGWVWLMANGPTWLHQLPGATASDVPSSVSHLALPVGAAYTGFFLSLALLTMRVLLSDQNWRIVWRCYLGLVLTYLLLLLAGRLGAGHTGYRISRMLLDFMISLLPVAGLLVLLWRPTVPSHQLANS